MKLLQQYIYENFIETFGSVFDNYYAFIKASCNMSSLQRGKSDQICSLDNHRINNNSFFLFNLTQSLYFLGKQYAPVEQIGLSIHVLVLKVTLSSLSWRRPRQFYWYFKSFYLFFYYLFFWSSHSGRHHVWKSCFCTFVFVCCQFTIKQCSVVPLLSIYSRCSWNNHLINSV